MVPDDTTRSPLLIGGGHAGPPGPDVRVVQGRRQGALCPVTFLWDVLSFRFCGIMRAGAPPQSVRGLPADHDYRGFFTRLSRSKNRDNRDYRGFFTRLSRCRWSGPAS